MHLISPITRRRIVTALATSAVALSATTAAAGATAGPAIPPVGASHTKIVKQATRSAAPAPVAESYVNIGPSLDGIHSREGKGCSSPYWVGNDQWAQCYYDTYGYTDVYYQDTEWLKWNGTQWTLVQVDRTDATGYTWSQSTATIS
jgi:hypothetical protein